MLKKNITLYKVMITILQLWKLSISPLIFICQCKKITIYLLILTF